MSGTRRRQFRRIIYSSSSGEEDWSESEVPLSQRIVTLQRHVPEVLQVFT